MDANNNVTIAAVIDHAPKYRDLANGAVASFALIIPGGGRRPDGIQRVTAWHDLARRCRDLQEGQRVLVEGSLESDAWVRSDGKTIPGVTIVAKRVTIIEAPPTNNFGSY